MFFDNLTTVAEVKGEYRRLAFKHHPDVGGDTGAMQKINAEYEAKLQDFDGQTNIDSQGKEHTYRYNSEVEKEIMNKIFEVIALKLPGLTVELVGTWIWIWGNTRAHKEQLKGLKFLWHSKRKMWYFRVNYAWKYSGKNFDDLRAEYGSRSWVEEDEKRIAV